MIAQKSLASYQARAIGNVVLSVCIVVSQVVVVAVVVFVGIAVCCVGRVGKKVKEAFSLLYLLGIACAFGPASTRRAVGGDERAN